MCLISRTNKPKVAKKDIVCYKVLRRTNPIWSVSGFETFYTSDPLPDVVISGKQDFIAQGKFRCELSEGGVIEYIFCGTYNIDYGQIHTYKSLKDVKKSFDCSIKSLKDDHECVVFKCIIPQGTKYFKGRFQTLNRMTFGVKSYCSDKIRFVEQIN